MDSETRRPIVATKADADIRARKTIGISFHASLLVPRRSYSRMLLSKGTSSQRPSSTGDRMSLTSRAPTRFLKRIRPYSKERGGSMKRLSALAVLGSLAGGAARGAEPVAAPTGFRAEFTAEVDSVGKKLTDLAGAMPAEKYSWRPAPGIRSVSEVYMHVVGANYLLPSMMGAKIPEGITRDMEKTVTEKARVI